MKTAAVLLSLIGVHAGTNASDEGTVMKVAYVQDAHGHCMVAMDGHVKFERREPPGTLWNVAFKKDTYWIIHAKTGKLLGIDRKKTELALFDEPGPTTTWQFNPAGAVPKPTESFKVILFMTLGEEDIRVSTDELGVTSLGGKATLMRFAHWSP